MRARDRVSVIGRERERVRVRVRVRERMRVDELTQQTTQVHRRETKRKQVYYFIYI